MCLAVPPAAPRYRDAGLTRPTVVHETRADGTMLMRAVEGPLSVSELGFSGLVARWAQERGDQVAFAQREGDKGWRQLTWLQFQQQMLSVAAGLLDLGLSQQRPLMILSGNSLEQVVLIAACDYIGVPSAPVSPAYALLSEAFTRLTALQELVQPGAVFVQSGAAFAKALQAMGTPASEIIAVQDEAAGQWPWRRLVEMSVTPERLARLEAARQAIEPARDAARIFFTSGSTGVPKGVPITYSNLAAMVGQHRYSFLGRPDRRIVMLDWMPWNHLFAGVGSLGRAFTHGGSYYIDDGRPQPGLFDRTVRNLREIAPTMFSTVPAAWALLASELERDDELARHFFSRLDFAGYGGASLPRDVWQRFQDAAVRVCGEHIVFLSGFGSTETTGLGSTFNLPTDDVGSVGVPQPGMELKLVPLEGGDGRYEVRMRGHHIFPGYLKRPDLTAAAFDDEGFYSLGDAVRLVEPDRPSAGLRYAGRCVEDFKLDNGTWVRTGSVRIALLEQCSPLLQDAVICGHDRGYVAALAWPNVAACRQLAPELADLDVEHLVAHPRVVHAVAVKLRVNASAIASQQVQRLVLMAEPPQPDAHEIADKGYINQAATRERRAALIDPLYAVNPAPDIVCK